MPNLVNVHNYIAAGFARFDFHQLDSKGLPAGITGTVTPGATGVAAGRIKAVTTANIQIPTPTLVPIPGDNVLQGSFQFPSDAVRSFQISWSEENFDNRQAFQNINPVDIGNHSFSGRDIQPFSLNNIMFVAVSNASAKKTGVSGLGMYAGVWATRANLTVQGRNAFTNRAAALFDGTVVVNPTDSYPWGQTFQSAIEGYQQSFLEDWTLAYPVTVHRWTQSGGAVTDFFLAEQPCSTSLDDVLVYVIDPNGTWARKTSGVTIDPVTRKLTFTPAPTLAWDIVAYYGFKPT